MQAGKMRHLITFQSRLDGQDAMGQPVSAWTDVITTRARVVSAAGKEEFKGQQFNPEVTHHVTVRWSQPVDTLTPIHRVMFGARILDILAINFGERKLDPVVIVCKERLLNDGDAQ